MIELTPDQKRAAEAEGSAAVTAGAGTGKTRMLAERYLHHVRSHGMTPLSIVAVTFTEKAAAELRSRIRETLSSKLGDEKTTAEVEAAQISTMHSLAARICRDFYDLAGIPADFTVLDEINSPLWSAEKFEEAVSGIDIEIAEDLGYKWLVGVLKVLLRDPIASEKALSLGAENWRQAIDEARIAAITDVKSSECWTVADRTLRDCCGEQGDTLENIRADVLAAMAADHPETAIAELNGVLKSFKSNSGSVKKWEQSSLDAVRSCLSDLKSAVKATAEIAGLAFGPDDEEAARRIPPLADAFRYVRDYIAAAKLREKVLDFGDLEHYALQILRQPEAIEHYSLRWRAFLVDEFQDTNAVQAEILDRLTKGASLTIVGDEKQSIYGFRGADAGVFTRIREQILNERRGIEVPLSLTFRAHAGLVATMNSIFEPVLGAMHQSLEAHRSESYLDHPFVHSAIVEPAKGSSSRQRQVTEARYISAQIRKLHDEKGVEYRDIAILGRRWAPLETYLTVMSANGIPAVNAGGGSLLETREAQDLYSMLSFLADPHDAIALVAVLRSPFFAFSDKELFAAAKHLSKDVSWWDVARQRPELGRAAAVLQQILNVADHSSAEQILRLADKLTGYGAVIANMPQGVRRVADLNGVYDLLRRLETLGRADIFGTKRYLRELYETETDIPRPPLEAGEAVTLMTIHRAKGLEWPVVFVPDLGSSHRGDSSPILVDRDLGVAFQIESDDYEKAEPAIHKLIKLRNKKREAEEARRLLYVAITRAKDTVFLTSAKDKGFDLDILRPGLDAAEIVEETIPFDEANAIAPSPGDPPPFPIPLRSNIAPVGIGLRELPVTALSVYARCPKRFEFQFVDGHPGLSDGFASAMLIGTLAHLALELDISEIDTLKEMSPGVADDALASALALAARFRSEAVYSGVRSNGIEKERRFAFTFGGLNLRGTADLIGSDFVLDYKTDAEMHPDEHRFQLWAYARALGKSTAYIAYLRNGELFRFDEDDLRSFDADALRLADGIHDGVYDATPSVEVCRICPYQKICEFRAVVEVAVPEDTQD
ncbi:MAG: UvrD-helicase domain-containing protein [Acidobacteriota bacterium]